MAISGKMVALKDKSNNVVFPETSSQAVYMDNGKTLETLTDEGVFFGENSDVVQLSKPEIIEKVNNMESKITEVDSRLEHIKNSNAINVFDLGAIQDGVFDNTEIFKKAISLNKPIIVSNITNKEFVIKERLNLSNSIFGVNYPKIKIIPKYNQSEFYGAGKSIILHILNSTKDIEITGLHLIGNFEETSLTEHSHGIAISASDNVKIYNNIIENVQGDCIYIGSNSFTEGVTKYKNTSDNIKIYNNKLINPYRCTVGNVSSVNLKIYNNTLIKNNTYVANIDNEPNRGDGTSVTNTFIYNNEIINNGKCRAILLTPTGNNINSIFINENTIKSLAKGIETTSANTDEFVYNLNIEKNKFECEDSSVYLVKDTKTVIINNNTDIVDNKSFWWVQGNNLIVEGNKFMSKTSSYTRGAVLYINAIDNCKINNNIILNSVDSGGSLIIHGSQEVTPKTIDIIDNSFFNCRTPINIRKGSTATSFSISNLNVKNNRLDYTEYGMIINANINKMYSDNTYIGDENKKISITSNSNIEMKINDECALSNQEYFSNSKPSATTPFYGTFVRNTTPQILGETGNKYLLFGWMMVQGSGWEEVRCPVGK